MKSAGRVYDKIKDKTVKSPKEASGKWTRARKLHTNGKLGVHNYKIMYRKNFWFVNHCRYFFSFGEGRGLSEQLKITPGECILSHSPERQVSSKFTIQHWLLNWFLFQVKKLKKGGRAVTYSPDGSSVAVGQNDGGFLILDSESLEKIVGFKDRKESISDIKFSPGNSCLVPTACFLLKVHYGMNLLWSELLSLRIIKLALSEKKCYSLACSPA